MGNTTNYVIIMLSVNLIMGLMALGIQSVNPESNLLLANKIFSFSNNALYEQTNNDTGIRTYAFNYSATGLEGLGGAGSFVETTDFKVPDWIRSGNNWFNSLRSNTGLPATMVNFMGAPYTILTQLNFEDGLASLIGVFWALLSTIIVINWLLGRDT